MRDGISSQIDHQSNNLVARAGVGRGDGSGGSGEVVTDGTESVLIGGPGEGEALAFGRDPVDGSLVGVSGVGDVVITVTLGTRGVTSELLLGVGFLAGGAIGSLVAVFSWYHKYRA